MGRITINETIAAPVDTVFAYVDDYRNTTKYMKDLVKWQPTTNVTHGKGAKFDVGMKAGPTTLSSVVDITTWTENRAIGWTSREGFKQAGKWSFAARADKTAVTFDMEYEFGGGIAGRMLGRAAEPIVRSNLQASVRNLKAQTEKIVPKQRSSSGRAAASGQTAPAKASGAKSARRRSSPSR
jgi:uncharacterized membrane protein